MTLELAARIVSIALGAALAALLAVLLPRYFGEALCPDCPRLRPLYRRRVREEGGRAPAPERVLLLSLAAFLASRAFFVAVAALGALAQGNLADFLANLPDRFSRWDASHYVGLIENWYVSEGDPRFHIVFFPLYPFLARMVRLGTGLSAMASGYLVSSLCLVGCGCALYGVIRIDQGNRAARRGLWLLMLCPVSFFFSAPFTESAFLLTTLLGVYFARRRMFLPAVLMGALSASARMLGMATAIPIFWEMLCAAREKGRTGHALAGEAALCVIKVLPVALGLAAYLLLNLSVTGDCFTFLAYQSEHWSQNFGSAMNTLRYTLVNAVSYANTGYRLGVWIPQAMAILGAAGLMAATWRKQRAGDAAYALVYFYCAVSPTWLLSGTRYLGAMYALYPMLTLLTRKKRAFAATLALEILMGAYMCAMYAARGAVM